MNDRTYMDELDRGLIGVIFVFLLIFVLITTYRVSKLEHELEILQVKLEMKR